MQGHKRIRLITGKSDLVVAAPHGKHDKGTGEIASNICRSLGVAGVVADDYVNPATGHRLNINRPTEGAGVDPAEEVPTQLAVRLYHSYLSAVLRASSNNLANYVEVHGNTHQELANRIEVAIWGVPQAVTRRILILYASKVKSALGVDLLIEGHAPIEKRAWANKLFGTLALAKQSLHFELPMKVRSTAEKRAQTAALLTEIIAYWWRHAQTSGDEITD